jgi:hypothetical protein
VQLRPKWPSSGVQVVVQDSAVPCYAVFFSVVVIASGYPHNQNNQMQLQWEERKPHYSEQQIP